MAHVAGGDRARGGRRSAGCGSCSACPTTFEGVIYDTASISTLHALAAAREAAVAGRARARARRTRRHSPALRVYCSRARALVGRQGGDPARPRPRRAARIPADARVPHAARRARATRSPTTAPPACCRSPSSPRSARTSTTSVDPVADDRRHLRARAALAARRRRLRRRRRDGARATNGSCAAPSAPTRSSSIRTSGCSRRSISACSTAGAWTCCARRSR